MSNSNANPPQGRVYTPIASGAILGNSLENDFDLPDVPNVLSLYPVEGDGEFLVREALKRDLSQVDRVRFDPINVCNLRCVFCPQDLERPRASISPESLRAILEAVASTCKRIIFGCAFEPTMAKNFSEYGEVIRDVVATRFVHSPVANIVTNGVLLGRHDLTPFVPWLSWIHVSFHSHIKEKFEMLEERAKFEMVRDNIVMIRDDFPTIRIHLEHVINSINAVDVVDFIRWAFFDLGVNSVNLRRMDGEMPKNDTSPLAVNLAKGISFALTDQQWGELVEAVGKTFPAVIAAITTAPGRVTDVVELTRAEIMAPAS